jgi:hypothetical protein
MRRSRENTKYWNNRILKLIELDSKYKEIKYIYDSLKLLLQEKYPFIKEHDNIQFLKDVLYLDRLMRLYREGEEEELKETLEQEFIINNLQ